MNRFKRELKKRGFKIANDFEYMPVWFENQAVLLEAVRVNAEKCTVTYLYNVATEVWHLQRSGEVDFYNTF